MEYRNYDQTPKDRLNEAFIKELLDLDDDCPSGKKYERHNDRVTSGEGCRRRNGGCRVQCGESYKDNSDEHVCDKNKPCGCGDCREFSLPALHGVPLAMVYSPHQDWDNIYDYEEGFHRGTIFKCLDLPFYGTSYRHNTCTCHSNDKLK